MNFSNSHKHCSLGRPDPPAPKKCRDLQERSRTSARSPSTPRPVGRDAVFTPGRTAARTARASRGRVSRRACFQASRSSRNRAIIAPPETTMREPDHGRAEYGAAPPQKKAWPGIQNFIPLASTRIHLHPPGRAPRSNPMRSHRRDEARTTTAMELATRSLPVVSSPIAGVFARTKDNSARQRGTDARCRSCGP